MDKKRLERTQENDNNNSFIRIKDLIGLVWNAVMCLLAVQQGSTDLIFIIDVYEQN